MTTSKTETGRPALWRVCIAAVVGSAIEGFDFLAYGTASALVFGTVFFANLDPTTATIASFATFATGLLARPFGGLLFGHYGDRVGRKTMLAISLVLMGLATVGIGLVPSYAAIGAWAPILLVLLRMVQGVAFGGEMGGAILMAVEHAPPKWKGILGALPLAGVPLGLVLSSASFALVTQLPESSFMAWGWRLPFLASVLLVIGGYYIRSSIPETPEFEHVKKSQNVAAIPALELMRQHWKTLLLTIGNKLGEVTLYYIVTVFMVSYAIKLGFTRSDTIRALLIGAICQVIGMLLAGWLCSRVDGRNVARIGGIAMAASISTLIALVESRSPLNLDLALIVALGLVHPLVYAPQAAFYSAQFPAHLRYSGLSIGIQFGAAIGGGMGPILATSMAASYGDLTPVAYYIGAVGLLATVCAHFMRPSEPAARQERPLGVPGREQAGTGS